MAEQEVVKHTKRVYKIWSSKEHSFWNKLKEFIIEILIIVFAVSLSISLHGWSEKRHEQAHVKSFLLGIKKDIQEDIEDIEELKTFYKRMDTIYRFFYHLNAKTKPNKDLLHAYNLQLGYNGFLRPHTNRFNSFLSSGRIANIENDTLALSLVNLYQVVLPSINSSELGWISLQNALNVHIRDNIKNVDDDMAYWEVLVTPKAKYLTKQLIPWEQIYQRYDEFIIEGTHIIQQINDRYSIK